MRNRLFMFLSVIAIMLITAVPAFAGSNATLSLSCNSSGFVVATYSTITGYHVSRLILSAGPGSVATISISGSSGSTTTTWTGANLTVALDYGSAHTMPTSTSKTISCAPAPISPIVVYGTLPPPLPSFNDGRLTNSHGDQIAVFSTVEDGKTGLQVWIVDGLTVPAFALDISGDAIEEAQAQEGVTLLIGETEDGLVQVYKLATGEIQINYGPDSEGKIFVYRFTDLRVGAYTFEVIELP
jgi:hypothetical protein